MIRLFVFCIASIREEVARHLGKKVTSPFFLLKSDLGSASMRYASIFLILAILLLASPGFVYGVDHVLDSSRKPEYLFVQSAKSGSFDGDKLTLRGIPLVIYFSDRPYRIAGHVSLKEFLGKWDKGSDSFRADPPNATLSIYEESGSKNAVIELMDPRIDGDSLTYKVRVLEGNVPSSFGASSLFIDGAVPI